MYGNLKSMPNGYDWHIPENWRKITVTGFVWLKMVYPSGLGSNPNSKGGENLSI